ncbi:MAG TPA: NAD(P)H-binding protein [Thermoplasmata archaeon]|nr:NAD(P)H-binding protein [Thermoplasmata archaeon]
MSRPRPSRVLLVGGGHGFVGRAVASELARDHLLRSAHRRPDAWEGEHGIEWMPTDVADRVDWAARLQGVDAVVNLAWYRAGAASRFRSLEAGLGRLLAAAVDAGLERFVHVSVPEAPEALERSLPYLLYKRQFDRSLARSGVPYTILRPTALFGPSDKLLGIMMRAMWRYPWFPMFGDGTYRLSPLSVADLARVVRLTLASPHSGTFDLGGPVGYRYRELTDGMFRALGKPARYWHLSPKGSLRLARLLESLGSSLIYRYEVEWLMSDRLGLAPSKEFDFPLERVEPYLALRATALRRTNGRSRAFTGGRR